MQHDRITALDGVRGLAILFVFTFHLTLGLPEQSLARNGMSWGWMGVDLFFVLSGFLITGILLDTINTAGYFRSFYIRRVLRIWPAYLACLLLVTAAAIGLVWYGADASASLFLGEGRWYWLHATNLLNARAHQFLVTPLGTGHFWSLALEEQFYLFWPLVIFVAGRTPRRAAVIAITLILGAACLRVVLLRRLGVDPVALYVLMPSRVDALAWGALVAALWRLDRELVATLAPVLLGAGILGLIAVTAHVGGVEPFAPAFPLLGYSLSGMAAAGVVAHACTLRRETWLSMPLLRRMGKYSYGIYIWHGPILYALNEINMSRPAFVCLAVVLSTAAARLSWLVIEQPALALKPVSRAVPIPQPTE